MELFWVFVAIVFADVVSTLLGIRQGLEDVLFGRRVLPMLFLAVAQIAGFYVIMQLLPLVPYMEHVVYAALAFRVAVVIWNIYLIMQERKNDVFSFRLFSADGNSGGVSVVPSNPNVSVYAGRVEDHQYVCIRRPYRPGKRHI